MESNRTLASESSCYSLRLSLDAESFIEFDPDLISLCLTEKAHEGAASILLDSSKSLLSRSYHHQSRYFYAVPSIPVVLNSNQKNMKDGTVAKRENFKLYLQKFLWFVLMKIVRRGKGLRLTRKKEGKAFVKDGRRVNRVSDVDSESSIHDAVLHCKVSNLSWLMEEES